MPHQQTDSQPQPFKLEFIQPYSTYTADGTSPPIPYVVDGLLTQGGLSVLGAKPKQGKSVAARCLAVNVAKGTPFLGRNTTRGEVILISLEDPLRHVDHHLKVLGYDPSTDASIQIIHKVPPGLDESIGVLREALRKMLDVRLVVVDHLAKLIRVDDLSDYMPVMRGVEKLRNLAREFPNLHILAIAHCKKVKTDDPFDAILGSTALRGETDTNIALYEQDGKRLIVAETREGIPLPPTVLKATLDNSTGAQLVAALTLDQTLDNWKSQLHKMVTEGEDNAIDQRILAYLRDCDGLTALQRDVLAGVKGRTATKLDAIKRLESDGAIVADGNPRSLSLAALEELHHE